MAASTRPEAVTLVLFALGGENQSIDTEDIAVRADEMFPGMFSWQKPEYQDRIDKELVRVALSDARLKKQWVIGSHNRGGWMLTPEGREFAQHNRAALDREPTRHARGRDEQQRARERIRLMTSDAFAQFEEGGIAAVTDPAADAFFRISVYVKGQPRSRKVTRLVNQFGGDPEIGELVRNLADRVLERN